MNAILSMSFPQVQTYCSVHQIQKVQAGPNQICPECAKSRVNQANAQHHESVQQMVRDKHFAGAMIPERYNNSGFKNYSVEHAGHTKALNTCISYSKAMLAGRKSNLIMSGRTGTGKTHLGCATARTLLNKGLFVRYITSEELAQRIMNAWDKDTKDQSEQSVVYDFTQYDLLIIDEYGLHDREKRTELVHKVLYARYDAAKPTMLISNFTMDQLRDDLGDRLWSRFQQGGLSVVECNWADMRVGGGV